MPARKPYAQQLPHLHSVNSANFTDPVVLPSFGVLFPPLPSADVVNPYDVVRDTGVLGARCSRDVPGKLKQPLRNTMRLLAGVVREFWVRRSRCAAYPPLKT